MSTSAKPVILYAWRTPNGFKPAILLEELKATYVGFDYDLRGVDIGKANEQKQPSYLAINPNGKIPALTDHTRNDFHVFESAAILLYLEQHFDKDKRFGFGCRTRIVERSSTVDLLRAWWCRSHAWTGGAFPLCARQD